MKWDMLYYCIADKMKGYLNIVTEEIPNKYLVKIYDTLGIIYEILNTHMPQIHIIMDKLT